MKVKLIERDTMLIDGKQSTLTGEYEFIGCVEGTNHFVVESPNTHELFIVPLHYTEVPRKKRVDSEKRKRHDNLR